MDIVLIALGLVALLGGGELLVRGALGLSVRFGMVSGAGVGSAQTPNNLRTPPAGTRVAPDEPET